MIIAFGNVELFMACPDVQPDRFHGGEIERYAFHIHEFAVHVLVFILGGYLLAVDVKPLRQHRG